MQRAKHHRPSAPLVINLIALSIVLGGQAIALPGRKVVKRDDLAAGVVTARNLAPGAITTRKLARHAVTDAALANRAVIGRAIGPRSVHGSKLAGAIQIPANLSDLDSPVDFSWTTSGSTATCPPGALLLNGGMTIQDSPSHRAFVQSIYPSSSNASTWVGQISTDTGGASPALLYAYCLS